MNRMSTLLKKFILSFLSSLILLLSFAPYAAVRAQNTPAWYNQDYKTWLEKVEGSPPEEIFGERYTSAQVQWVIYGLFTFILNSALGGGDNNSVLSCIMTNTANLNACAAAIQSLTAKTNIPPPFAAVPKEPGIWAKVFLADRPISGIAYTKKLIQKFDLVPVAQAQTTVGYGFTALRPIQGMWRSFRNVAYSLFTIVAVIFAFLIMFRVKLSPQTVITVQSALPKIVLALVAVTFSYAIAGFLIDLMYVVIGLISVIGSALFRDTGLTGAVLNVQFNPTEIFNFLTLGQPWGGSVQAGVLILLGFYVFAFAACLVVVMFISNGVFLGTIALPIIILLALLIVVIGLLIAIWIIFKTVWMLIKAFVNIILLTIFAPLQLSIGALIPNFGFGAWVRSYLSALSTFVVVGVLLLFSYLFLVYAIAISLGSLNFAENFRAALLQFVAGNYGAQIGNAIGAGTLAGSAEWPPLLGSAGTATGVLFLGVSFVLFTMIPKAAEVTQAFMSGKPFAYGSAIGESMGLANWGWGQWGAPLWGTAKRNREEEYIARTFGRARTRMENAGYTSTADWAGIKEPKDLAAAIRNLTDQLKQGK